MTDLFLKRPLQDQALAKSTQDALNEWASKIAFSPIKEFTKQTKLVSLTEHAAYTTTVTTQIEKRWLVDHEVPFRKQSLPPQPLAKSAIDLWKLDLPWFADFGEHARSQELFETRQSYDCDACRTKGTIKCPECGGAGDLWCEWCKGAGWLRKTRTVSRQFPCQTCNGTGFTGMLTKSLCTRCGGNGFKVEMVREEYKDPCTTCAAQGRVRCWKCQGSRELTCQRCNGEGQLMRYVSAEQSESPEVGTRQFLPVGLPSFTKKDSPITNLAGDQVFLQDEKKTIKQIAFSGEEAASVLIPAVEECRESHVGHVLRQRIKIERCSIVEYRYQYNGTSHSIFVNPTHKLVEDTSGPIFQAISNSAVMAQKALIEKRYEDAYRFALRTLCMGEATEELKALRAKVLKRLATSYRGFALLGYLLGWGPWVAAHGIQYLGFAFGLVPLFGGAFLFSQDYGLGLGPSARRTAGLLIGLCAAIPSFLIDYRASPDSAPLFNLWPNGVLGLLIVGLSLFRLKESDRRSHIEAYLKEFPDSHALEAYVVRIDPSPSRTRSILATLLFVLLCLLIIVSCCFAIAGTS